jgi:ATP-dependent RNA helicase HelY
VAGLAGTRTYPLNSSFQPSYNMAVNLVGQVGRQRAAALLESSFAQFQADRGVVGLSRQASTLRAELAGLAPECGRGDIAGYAALRRELSGSEGSLARSRRAARQEEALASLVLLRRGDIIAVPGGRRAGIAVVLEPAADGGTAGPLVLTEGRQARRLPVADFPVPVQAIERIRIPSSFSHRSAHQRRDLAATVRNKLDGRDLPRTRGRRGEAGGAGSNGPRADDAEITRLRRALRDHPCHQCPDREAHLRAAERCARVEREAAALEDRVARRSHVLARTFDRVCAMLADLGYLSGDSVTADGRRLSRMYAELDLVAAESLRRGAWAGLSAPELAACVSALTFEARRPDDASPPRLPPGRVKEVLAGTVRLWGELAEAEAGHDLHFLRAHEPDLGFAWSAHAWARGADLQKSLGDLTPGDFVRAVKQLIDLLDQVAIAAGDDPLARTARQAISALRRGVIAYSSVT